MDPPTRDSCGDYYRGGDRIDLQLSSHDGFLPNLQRRRTEEETARSQEEQQEKSKPTTSANPTDPKCIVVEVGSRK